MLLQMARLGFLFERVARRLRDDERGQGMVEYALIITLVALAAVTAFTGLGNAIVTAVGNITTQI